MRIRSLIAVSLLTASILSNSAFAEQQTFSTKPFIDVPKSNANYTAIEYLRKHNVLRGYLDGSYKPDSRITRAEFVKLIANPYIVDTQELNDCLKKKIPGLNTRVFFDDVKRDDWFAPELCFAKVKKLVSGYPDNTFKPNANITFAEAAKILISTFALQTHTSPDDVHWYKPYVEELADHHAIPKSITRFDEILTRGEMAEMLYRLKTNNTKLSSKTYAELR